MTSPTKDRIVLTACFTINMRGTGTIPRPPSPTWTLEKFSKQRETRALPLALALISLFLSFPGPRFALECRPSRVCPPMFLVIFESDRNL